MNMEMMMNSGMAQEESVAVEGEQIVQQDAAQDAARDECARNMAAFRREMEATLTARMEEMLAEALRVSRMTDAERTDYAAARRESDLEAREKRLAVRELRAEALEMLAHRGLPPELADAIGYESREGMMAALDGAERAFRSAVQTAVEERLRGEVPAAGASSRNVGMMDDAEYYRMNYAAH